MHIRQTGIRHSDSYFYPTLITQKENGFRDEQFVNSGKGKVTSL